MAVCLRRLKISEKISERGDNADSGAQTSGLMKTVLESLIFGKETKIPLRLKLRHPD